MKFLDLTFTYDSLKDRIDAAVGEVLASGLYLGGPHTRAFEAEFAAFCGSPHCIGLSNGLDALYAILRALEVGPGDEVIVPAHTFVATWLAVGRTGATLVPVDADPETMNWDTAAVARAIGPRTRVVMPVHLYGQMVDMRRLAAAIKEVRADIVLLEDGAHAFEATYGGERPGRHGDLAIFSFYATKNVTCGEGGAIIGHDPALMERLRQALLHGMSAGAADRFAGAYYRHWDVENLGTKANLPDLLAALLPAQIAHIDERRETRQALVDRYRAGLHPALRFAAVRAEARSAHHLFPIHVPGELRDRFLYELNSAGIGTTVNYRSVHRLTFYSRKYGIADAALPVSAAWGDGVVSLPLYLSLDEPRQNYVIERVNELVDALL